MPGSPHEVLLMLFRERPVLAAELLRDPLGVELPEFGSVETTDANLTQIVPTEYRADLVILLKAGEPVLGIVVEIQLGRDDDKPYTWPLYAAALRARFRCPCCVLVVTPKDSVARWAATPVETGPPGCVFTPLVLGPHAVPRVTDPVRAREAPELAMLSVLAHGKTEDGARVAMAALAMVDGLDDETAVVYYDQIWLAVSAAAKRKLEEHMRIEGYEYQSEFARKYFSAGREEGRQEGRQEGRAAGQAEALLRVLSARGLEVTEDQRSRILKCTDRQTLDGWLDRAPTADHIEDLFR